MNALYVSPASAPSAITVGSMGVSKVQGGDYVARRGLQKLDLQELRLRVNFMKKCGDNTVAN